MSKVKVLNIVLYIQNFFPTRYTLGLSHHIMICEIDSKMRLVQTKGDNCYFMTKFNAQV